MTGGFPAGPGVKSSPSNVKYEGLIPSWGTEIPHAQGTTKPAYCNKDPTQPNK